MDGPVRAVVGHLHGRERMYVHLGHPVRHTVPVTRRPGCADQAHLVNKCLDLRPETDDLRTLASEPDRLLLTPVKTRFVGHRTRFVKLHRVGVEVAAPFLVTAGDNRIHLPRPLPLRDRPPRRPAEMAAYLQPSPAPRRLRWKPVRQPRPRTLWQNS